MLPCTGRIDEALLLKAFEKGASGVLVMGCQEDACQHLTGNSRAKQRVEYARNLLKEIGIEEERVMMLNLGPDMAQQFSKQVNEMSEKIEKLGSATKA